MTNALSLVAGVLLLAVPGLPLIFAVLVFLSRNYGRIARFTPWGALPGLICAFSVFLNPDIELPWMIFGSRFALDEVGATFLLVTSVVWLFGALQLVHGDRRFSRQFTGCFHLAMAGNMAALVVADMPSFYLFFAIMSFAAYGLIVEDATEQAYRAGRIYMVLVIFGEVALFAGLSLTAASNGTLDLPQMTSGQNSNAAAFLLFVGFGVKAGLVPVHFSLPLAYLSAPSPARFVLAGAMLNAGVCGWLRFLPIDSVSLPGWNEALMFVGIISVFYGLACGLGQRDARALLAYSSISQIGYVVMLLGAGLAGSNPVSVNHGAILLFAVHHSLAKAALFWGYDLWIESNQGHTNRVIVGIGLLIAAAAIAGAPFTSGALAKAAMTMALSLPLEQSTGISAILMPIGAMATTLLMVRFLLLCRSENPVMPATGRVPLLYYAVFIGLVIIVAWFVGMDGLDRISLLKPINLWTGTWPILAGIAVFFVCRLVIRAMVGGHGLSVPPGDIVVGLEKGITASQAWCAELSLMVGKVLHRAKTETKIALTDVVRKVPVQNRPWGSAITGAFLMTILFILIGLLSAR